MTEVTELTGSEGGVWRVWTQSSSYLMDLNRGTVTRVPGAAAAVTINDGTRLLRGLVRCRVGEGGYWTMKSEGYLDPNDSYWQSTTIILSIERLDEEEFETGVESSAVPADRQS